MIILSILLFNSFISKIMWGFPYTLCVKEEMPPRCDYLSFPAFFLFFFPYRPIKLAKNGTESYFKLEDFLFSNQSFLWGAVELQSENRVYFITKVNSPGNFS